MTGFDQFDARNAGTESATNCCDLLLAEAQKLMTKNEVKVDPKDIIKHLDGPVVLQIDRNETLSTGDRFTARGSRVVYAGPGIIDGTGGRTSETLQTPDGYSLSIGLYDKWGNVSRSIGLKTPDGTAINVFHGGDYSQWSVVKPDGTKLEMPAGFTVNDVSIMTEQGPIRFQTGSRYGDLTITMPGGAVIQVGNDGVQSVTRNGRTHSVNRQ